MPYSQFKTIASVKSAFNLTTVEGDRFLPDLKGVAPSHFLTEFLQESLPIVAISGSEKARSEGIIYPLLLEVRRLLDRNVSLFSGEDFTVDETAGLNGICDFLMTRSNAVIVVEAKKADLKTGVGQCIAEMVAAQRFNAAKEYPISTIYGSVSNGLQWQFLALTQSTVTIDLNIYTLPPADLILGYFVWMLQG